MTKTIFKIMTKFVSLFHNWKRRYPAAAGIRIVNKFKKLKESKILKNKPIPLFE